MSVEVPVIETESIDESVDSPHSGYGGEVSARTLIEDVRAIRQRLDGVEVALRGLSVRLEELTPAAAAEGTAGAPVGSLDELRKALIGDLQVDLRKNAKRVTLLMGALLLMTLAGLGGLAWMLRQLE